MNPEEAAAAALAASPAPANPAPAPASSSGASAPATTTAGPVQAPQARAYPSPKKYVGTPEAALINGILDSLDDPPEGARVVDPASSLHVGECALATWESMNKGETVQVHPGWMLLGTALVYLLIVVIHRFAPRTDSVDQPAEGRHAPVRRAQPVSNPGEGNLFEDAA